MSGRRHAHTLTAWARREGTGFEVFAPKPGLYRSAPAEGSLVRPGDLIGELEVLGQLHQLFAPADVFGVVRGAAERGLARRPVDRARALFTLDPEAAGDVEHEILAEVASDDASGPVFRSPLGGRFYARPSPDAPPFVQAGDEVATGQTVAIIEVMKTFNRVQYGGANLPDRAKVRRVVPPDGTDLEAGEPLLELEKA